MNQIFKIFQTADTNAATVWKSHFHTTCWCSFPPWLITDSVPAPTAQPQRSTIRLPASLWKRTDYGHRLLSRRKLNCVVVCFLFVNVTSCFLFVSFSEGCTMYFRECDRCVCMCVCGTLVLQFHVCLLISVSIALCPQRRAQFLDTFTKFAKLSSSCLFFCLTVWNNSALSGWIFIKFDIRGFLFENQPRKFKFH